MLANVYVLDSYPYPCVVTFDVQWGSGKYRTYDKTLVNEKHFSNVEAFYAKCGGKTIGTTYHEEKTNQLRTEMGKPWPDMGLYDTPCTHSVCLYNTKGLCKHRIETKLCVHRDAEEIKNIKNQGEDGTGENK